MIHIFDALLAFARDGAAAAVQQHAAARGDDGGDGAAAAENSLLHVVPDNKEKEQELNMGSHNDPGLLTLKLSSADGKALVHIK